MPSCAALPRFTEKTMSETLSVEVCYALPDKQEIVAVKVPAGATLQQALDWLTVWRAVSPKQVLVVRVCSTTV